MPNLVELMQTIGLDQHCDLSCAARAALSSCVELCDAAFDGRWTDARSLHERFLPLLRADFAGAPNPVPAKAVWLGPPEMNCWVM